MLLLQHGGRCRVRELPVTNSATGLSSAWAVALADLETVQTRNSREAFERWFTGSLARADYREYISARTQRAWIVWQAAWIAKP